MFTWRLVARVRVGHGGDGAFGAVPASVSYVHVGWWAAGQGRCALNRSATDAVVVVVVGQAVGTRRGRLYFENCTVDASIFVVKLVRAHGGCLGTRSR